MEAIVPSQTTLLPSKFRKPNRGITANMSWWRRMNLASTETSWSPNMDEKHEKPIYPIQSNQGNNVHLFGKHHSHYIFPSVPPSPSMNPLVELRTSARGTSHKSNTATQPVTATRPEATSAQSGHGITSHLCLDLGTWHVAHCGTARWIEFVHLCITCIYIFIIIYVYIYIYIYILIDIDSKLGFGESSGGSMLTRKEELKIGRWHSDSSCWGCDSNVGLKTGYLFPISAVILRYTS